MRRSAFIIIITCLSIILLMSLSLSPTGLAPTSLAQRATPTSSPGGRDTPTPANTPSPGGDDDDDGKPVPTPQTGGVQGFVYNYSNGAMPEAGITVVLDGGGWKAETVTNSEGYYVFAGLGSGSAKINVLLPPEAHSVMPDWPVHTGSPQLGNTNLGFYWGDTPPLPVILSASKSDIAAMAGQSFSFEISVKNQSGAQATNGKLDVELPGMLTAVEATANHGQVDFTEHRVWVEVENLADGESLSLSVSAQVDHGVDPQELAAQVIFTYDQQLTPQLQWIKIAADSSQMQAQAAPAAQAEADTTEETDVAAADTTEEAAESDQLIPTTGNEASLPPSAWVGIVLSAFFIIGLSFAGLRAFGKRV